MYTHQSSRSAEPSSGRWRARRLMMAVLAYGAAVSVSVAAAVALVDADIPVEALITVC